MSENTENTVENNETVESTKQPMPIEKIVFIVAGSLILLSLLLSVYVAPAFIYLTALVGASMLFSGLTGFCPMVLILRKLGFKHGLAFR